MRRIKIKISIYITLHYFLFASKLLPAIWNGSFHTVYTWDWIPRRFSFWVAQKCSSTRGPGWSPLSSSDPESFFRTFHICSDHWTIRVSIEYNNPWSTGQLEGLKRQSGSGFEKNAFAFKQRVKFLKILKNRRFAKFVLFIWFVQCCPSICTFSW